MMEDNIMVIKKKQIITATLAMALGAAVFVNWYYTKPQTMQTLNSDNTTTTENENLGDAQYVSATTATKGDETLADFKLKRDSARDEAKETLNSIIKDSKSSEKSVSQATESLQIIADDIKDEADLENLITAKISADCVVIIDAEVCQIIVDKGVLSPNVSLQIKDLVVKQTKIPSKNITIIELNG